MTEHERGLREQGDRGERTAEGSDSGGPQGLGLLHERESELRAAEAAIRALRGTPGEPGSGIGELLLYEGPAGLGKTALLTEVRRLARRQADCTVLFARGGEQQRQEPFHVVRQLLRPVLGTLSDDERRQVFGQWHDIVGPAVGLLPPAGQLDPQGVRDGLDFVLGQLARRREPLAVMVDDLHWADLESLGWLASFAVHARELPVLVVLTNPAATVNQLRLALDEKVGLSPQLRVDATFRLAQALAHSNQLGEAARVCGEEALLTEVGPGRQRLDIARFMFAAFQAKEDDGPERSRRLERFARTLAGGEQSMVSAVLVLRCWDLTLQGGGAAGAVAMAESALEDGRLPSCLGWTNTLWGFELPGILGLTYLYADRIDRAEALFDEAIWAYRVAGWSGAHLGFAYFLMGLLRFRQGRLREAEDLLRRALHTAERIAPGIPLQWFTVGVLADTLLARGRTAEALELAERYSFGPPYPTVMVLPDAPTLYGRLLLARA